jgi:hypothetical protein
MPSSAPSPGGWLRVPSSVPLIPTSSEYDRLLVQEPLDEIGGGPMDPATDERLLVLDDAKRIAAEGLAERIAARAASPRGVIFGSVACLALMCYAAFRKVESHDASLVSRLSEGMFQSRGGGDVEGRFVDGHAFAKRRVDGHAVVQEGHEFPLEHRLAPRAAAMPRDDDGAAQRAVDDAAAGTSERSALRAATRGARTAPRRKEARLGRQADFSAAWGSWEDEAEANGYGETYGEAVRRRPRRFRGLVGVRLGFESRRGRGGCVFRRRPRRRRVRRGATDPTTKVARGGAAAARH